MPLTTSIKKNKENFKITLKSVSSYLTQSILYIFFKFQERCKQVLCKAKAWIYQNDADVTQISVLNFCGETELCDV
jgi:hypothetical protein